MSDPRFSVIVPAHNEAELVSSAITSVLRQSVADWELVLVDDGSSDGTARVGARFAADDPRITLVSTPNQGLSAARNTGIERSRAPNVSFLDSDDLLMPHYLERMGAALEAAPEAGFAYTDAWALDADTHRIRRATAMSPWHPPSAAPADPLEMMRMLLRDNFVFVSTTVPRAVLEGVGGFDASLASAEDYDLWLRILAAGRPAVSPDGVLGIKRERAGAMSQNHATMLSAQVSICRRLVGESGLPADVRALAEARARRLEGVAAGLDGSDRGRALLIGARRALSPLRGALQPGRRWRRRPPHEVREAFPDLDRL
jgi:glycosyltransferase involved in cell wall biosynthesis